MGKKRKKEQEERRETLLGLLNSSGSFWVDSFTLAEPGWEAVFRECKDCKTPQRSFPVIFWALIRWPNGSTDIAGMVRDPSIGGFIAAPVDHAWVGYAEPGMTTDEVVATWESFYDG